MLELSIGFDLVWKILFTYVTDIDALDIIDTRVTVSCLIYTVPLEEISKKRLDDS